MKIKIVSFIKEVGVLTTALTLALVANFAYGQWSGPSGAPSAGTNVDSPLNVGIDNQIKIGGITVDGTLSASEVAVDGTLSASEVAVDGTLSVSEVAVDSILSAEQVVASVRVTAPYVATNFTYVNTHQS
ncbi:MAG: hypothetical protein ACI9BF_000704, partial [Candidatus Paceibacteria bacterium]